jgi:hypothetical protein
MVILVGMSSLRVIRWHRRQRAHRLLLLTENSLELPGPGGRQVAIDWSNIARAQVVGRWLAVPLASQPCRSPPSALRDSAGCSQRSASKGAAQEGASRGARHFDSFSVPRTGTSAPDSSIQPAQTPAIDWALQRAGPILAVASSRTLLLLVTSHHRFQFGSRLLSGQLPGGDPDRERQLFDVTAFRSDVRGCLIRREPRVRNCSGRLSSVV